MRSIYDIALNVNAVQAVFLVGHKLFPNRFIKMGCRFKASHGGSEGKFFGMERKGGCEISRNFFRGHHMLVFMECRCALFVRINGINQILDDTQHDLNSQANRTIMWHLLCQDESKGLTSSAFPREMCFNDRNSVWAQLMGRNEGSAKREPDSKKVRSLLINLRLYIRMSWCHYQNYSHGCTRRLEDVGSVES